MENLILNDWSVSSSLLYVLKERLNSRMPLRDGQAINMIKWATGGTVGNG